MNNPHKFDSNSLSKWMDSILAKEKWFVEPRYNVPKSTQDTISVGVLSPFCYDFSTIALGSLSIYHSINRDPNCPGIADRILVYDPITDENYNIFTNLKLEENLKTLERRIPLNKLDLICISLTGTDSITTILQILKLGGIPLLRSERQSGNYPLILAGGPGCINPEIFADFFDFFSMGDGCILSKKIVQAIHKLKIFDKKKKITGKDIFETIEDNSSLYVPELYNFTFKGEQITNIEPYKKINLIAQAVDPPIEYTQVSLFSNGQTAVIVPSRGCKNNCGYCLLTGQGYREADVKPLLEYVDKYIECGINSIVVNAASSTQYKEISILLDKLAEKIEKASFPIQVYLGSLCFDELTDEILKKIDRLKAFNHTYSLYTNGKLQKVMALAPEHGSLDILRGLGRKLNSWNILNSIDKAKKIGVYNFTLYLIVGFLSETAKDREQTAALASAIADKVYENNGKVTLKINPIIPTPGTACQRMGMPSVEDYKLYLKEIENGVKSRIGEERYKEQISIVSLPEERLLVESIIDRADRRISKIILKVLDYRSKGKSIDELELKKWVEESDFTWEHLTGQISLDAILPWQMINLINPKHEEKILTTLQNRINEEK